MKSKDLRDLSIQELTAKKVEFKKEIFSVKFQLHTGRLENTARIPSLKKDIARVETIIKEKEAGVR
jgi:large subunit ribosomal protein L29